MAATTSGSGAPPLTGRSRAARKLVCSKEPLGTVVRTTEGRDSSDRLMSSGPSIPHR